MLKVPLLWIVSLPPLKTRGPGLITLVLITADLIIRAPFILLPLMFHFPSRAYVVSQ